MRHIFEAAFYLFEAAGKIIEGSGFWEVVYGLLEVTS
jgi:hypothetical protein